MPGVALHGGGASKVSNWYEETWTLYTMLDMLAGLATAITLEPPGTANQGFEFYIDRPQRREWHQVKFHEGRQGKWTLARLADENVLEHFRAKLVAQPEDACWFISADSTFPMNRLCSHAAKAPDLTALKDTFLSNAEFREAFDSLRDHHWKLDDHRTWAWLKARVIVRSVDDPFLEQTLRERVQTFVTGDADAAIEVLRAIMKEALYVPIDRALVESKLTERGHAPRTWSTGADSIEDKVTATSRGFVDSVRKQLIHDGLIARNQIAQITSLLDQTHPPSTILLTGSRGNGKSAVLAQVIESRLGSPWRVLTLDLTRFSREGNTDDVAATLDLPMRPGAALAAAAQDCRGLFVIDAMDWVGINRTQRPELFTVLDAIIKEARAYPNVTLLISCRSEDLANDDRLKSLAEGLDPAERVEVPPLTVEQVHGALAQAGVPINDLIPEQLELLRTPMLLKYLIDSKDAGPFVFVTAQQIMDRYANWKTGIGT